MLSPRHPLLRRAPLLLLALLLPVSVAAYEDELFGTVSLVEQRSNAFIVRPTARGTSLDCFAALECTPGQDSDVCSVTLRLTQKGSGQESWEDKGRVSFDYQAGTATWEGIKLPSQMNEEARHWEEVVAAVMLQRER